MVDSKNRPKNKNGIKTLLLATAVLTGAILVLSGCSGAARSNPSSTPDTATAGQASFTGAGISINKSEITSTAKFIPYQAGDTKMEVLAVQAPDGTIRTALNTCQVCFDSGRGYYKQEGDVLVCQNCGNRFKISQIEKEKNGCTPVPILEGDKTDDGTTISISADFLEQYKELFANWKTN